MSPAPSSDRDAMFATSAELDDGALAELREFTAAFERRLADAPPTESVPAGSIARGRLPGTRDVLIAMGIDTDDVIQFVCKHSDRSSVRRVRYAGLEHGNRAAGL
jgi:hypothetical protein